MAGSKFDILISRIKLKEAIEEARLVTETEVKQLIKNVDLSKEEAKLILGKGRYKKAIKTKVIEDGLFEDTKKYIDKNLLISEIANLIFETLENMTFDEMKERGYLICRASKVGKAEKAKGGGPPALIEYNTVKELVKSSIRELKKKDPNGILVVGILPFNKKRKVIGTSEKILGGYLISLLPSEVRYGVVEDLGFKIYQDLKTVKI